MPAAPAPSSTVSFVRAKPTSLDPIGRPLRVLVGDGDLSTQNMLAGYLREHNMHVVPALQRHDVDRQFAFREPNVVILDLSLGSDDGLDLLRKIRTRSDVPVIITMDQRPAEITRVVGLELGADHYLIKPFGPRELLARIRAVLRRQALGRIAWERDSEQGRCRFGGWQLDRRTHHLIDPIGKPVALTRGEYALLVAFVNSP
jgi:DNA-binding response OmpR family regulator